MSDLQKAVKSPMSLCVQVFVPLVSGALDCFGLEVLHIFLPLCYRHTSVSPRLDASGWGQDVARRAAAAATADVLLRLATEQHRLKTEQVEISLWRVVVFYFIFFGRANVGQQNPNSRAVARH